MAMPNGSIFSPVFVLFILALVVIPAPACAQVELHWWHAMSGANTGVVTRLAKDLQAIPVLVEDGDVLQLAPGRPDVVEGVPTGRLAVDNGRLLPITGGVLAARKRMLFNGVVMASFAVDEAGRVLGTPQVSAPGLLDGDDHIGAQLAADLARAVGDLPSGLRREDDALREAARSVLRKAIGRRLRKRPSVEVHLLRV